MEPHLYQPKCSCLQCSSYSFVYSSLFDVHRCLECELEVQAKYINNIIVAFGVHKKEPYLVGSFNAINCISCMVTGGVHFDESLSPIVYCKLCSQRFRIDDLHNVMTSAYKTKLIESSFNYKFDILRK